MTGKIIEFFGAPGAGKTFLAEAVTRRLQAEGFGAKLASQSRPSRRYEWKWLINGLSARKWLISHPLYCRQYYQLLTETKQQDQAACHRLFWAWIKTVDRQHRLRKRNTFTLQDHGCWQLLWMIGYEADPDNWQRVLPSLAELVTPADILISIAVETPVLCKRLIDRRSKRGVTSRVQQEDLTDTHVQSRIETLVAVIDERVRHAENSNKTSVIRIDNSKAEDSASNIELVAEAIKSLG